MSTVIYLLWYQVAYEFLCVVSSDSSVDRSVQVHTSLPPKVDGQLRCYLKLKVSHIAWLIPNSPDVTHVRVCWWGEDGPGTLFRYYSSLLTTLSL